MRILFLHQNFPGQFLHLAQALHETAGHQVRAITDAANRRPDIVPTRHYRFESKSAGRPHRLAAHFALRVARGEAVAREMQALEKEGFVPDLVIGHPGWGETLFVRDVWPGTRLILHTEFYYRPVGGDADFDPEFAQATFERRARTRMMNAAMLAALSDADFGVAPTRWQGESFPAELRRKIAVIHEGIDTDRLRPDPGARVALAEGGPVLRAGDEVITFVNRNLEPYRGYHVFMRALPDILAARPQARAVIVGGDDASYGPAAPAGTTWKDRFLDEVRERLPLDRVHFLGKVPYGGFIELMQVSAVHVYLTYPFVLSWSMLEAMSTGALVVASRTPPVEEVIEHGRNGLLFDFFDGAALARTVIEVLTDPARHAAIRGQARQSIQETYDLRDRCLPQWLRFIAKVTASAR